MRERQIAQITLPAENGTQELQPPSGIEHLSGGLDTTGQKFINTGYQLFFIVAIIVALIFMMFSGIQWITSGGDSEKLASEKKRMVFAILGLMLVAAAFFIANMVVKTTGGDTNFFFSR
ncbi:hypothetical protein HYW46_06985 [Candidatus Daviesbacteria bacterium]|nr:hypothetical protein [Candidatus Daviesbacteria bacterium]